MAYRIIGIFIMAAAGIVGYLVLKNDIANISGSSGCQSLTPAQQLSQLIREDFEQLKRNQELPKSWGSIASIEIQMNSVLAKALLGQEKLGFDRDRDGKYFLELNFLDLPDDINPGIIVQASLFDIRSKNKIFEIGRTYTMAQLNKTESTSKDQN